MGTPFEVYFKKKALPIIGIGILIPIICFGFFPEIFNIYGLSFFVWAVPLYAIIVAFIYPLVLFERRAKEIDQEMHLFITRIGVMSLSDVSRKGMFGVLAEMKEYGELAVEIKKVFNLIDIWNISMGDACRIVARSTPSKIFSYFLQRLAHAVEGGEAITDFFKNEQVVVMDQYETTYKSALDASEIMIEVFVAMVVVASFIIVLISIYPLLTGKDATELMVFAAFIFIFVEFVFLYFLISVLPRERIWHSTGIKTELDSQIKKWFKLGLSLSVLFGFIVFLLNDWFPKTYFLLPIQFAIIITPMVIPGYFVTIQEGIIRGRDDNYSAFIRSLGGTASTGGIGPTGALKKLTLHDFGPLTKNIDDLYKRLALGINSKKAWRHFGAETGSELTSKFSDMYVEGASLGGDPKKVSNVISDNFIRMLALRNRRYQSAGIFTGVMYGVCVAISVVLYLALMMVDVVNEAFTDIEVPSNFSRIFADAAVLKGISFEVDFLQIIIFLLIIFHSLIAALMIKVVKAGHNLGTFVHFVGMVWIGAILSVVVEYVMRIVF